MANISLRKWIENYNKGAYNDPSLEVQCNAGWYDWFCKDSSLVSRLKKMAPKIIRIAKSKKVDLDAMYVFFKNNCPVYGKLYDDFRLCNIESGKVVYTIVPSSGDLSNNGQAKLWGRENGFKEPLIEGTMNDIYEYFGV